MTRIVAIGECMIEMAPSNTPENFTMGFAGDTMNTAWYLRQLMPKTASVDYFTAVGGDAASQQMIGFLKHSNLGTEKIITRSDRSVGLYMIQLNDGERSFSYWRDQSAAKTLAQDRSDINDALSDADIAYFSGITIAILPALDRQNLLEALAAFRKRGGVVAFDPNLRPKLWSNTAEMTDAVMKAARVSDIVLPSHEDEATWFGDPDLEATATRYVEAGAKLVVVKNGSGQMLAWDDGITLVQNPVVVSSVVDTTAAGDSFNAGFLAEHLGGSALCTSVLAGAELASKVIQARGALISGLA